MTVKKKITACHLSLSGSLLYLAPADFFLLKTSQTSKMHLSTKHQIFLFKKCFKKNPGNLHSSCSQASFSIYHLKYFLHLSLAEKQKQSFFENDC